jgi:hypothetical protein
VGVGEDEGLKGCFRSARLSQAGLLAVVRNNAAAHASAASVAWAISDLTPSNLMTEVEEVHANAMTMMTRPLQMEYMYANLLCGCRR